MHTHSGIRGYIMSDGSWRPNHRHPGYWWTPGDFYRRDEWKTHQKTLDSALRQTTKTDREMVKLQNSISELKEAHLKHTEKQDECAERQDTCLLEVEKVYQYLEAQTRRENEQERVRYWTQRLQDTYDEGKKHGEEEVTSSARKARRSEELRSISMALDAQKQEKVKERQQQDVRHSQEAMVSGFHALETKMKTVRREALQQREDLRMDDAEKLARVLRRPRRYEEEEDREVLNDARVAQLEAQRRRESRLRRDRPYSPGREAHYTFVREQRPHSTTAPATHHGRRPKYADHAEYSLGDDHVPWLEESVEEEKPVVYYPAIHRDCHRTAVRGTSQPSSSHRGWHYR